MNASMASFQFAFSFTAFHQYTRISPTFSGSSSDGIGASCCWSGGASGSMLMNTQLAHVSTWHSTRWRSASVTHSGGKESRPYTNELVPSRFHRQPWKGQTICPPRNVPHPTASCVARWRHAFWYALISVSLVRTTITDWSATQYSTKSPTFGISSRRHAFCHTCGQSFRFSSSKKSWS